MIGRFLAQVAPGVVKGRLTHGRDREEIVEGLSRLNSRIIKVSIGDLEGASPEWPIGQDGQTRGRNK